MFSRSTALSSLALGLGLYLLAQVAPQTASAQNASLAHDGGDFGLGLIIGDPTGLNGKYFLSSEMAIDGSIGAGFIGGDHLQINMDFLWHFGIQRWSAVTLDLYLGVGPMLGIIDHDHPGHDHNDVWLGARGPFGAALSFNNAPVDIFLEIALGLWIVSDVDVDVDAAIGVRYWF